MLFDISAILDKRVLMISQNKRSHIMRRRISMSNGKIMVDPLKVAFYTKRIRTGNAVFSASAPTNISLPSQTNLTGFKKGIKCKKRLGAVVWKLSGMISTDSTNLDNAAKSVRGLDKHLSQKIKKAR